MLPADFFCFFVLEKKKREFLPFPLFLLRTAVLRCREVCVRMFLWNFWIGGICL